MKNPIRCGHHNAITHYTTCLPKRVQFLRETNTRLEATKWRYAEGLFKILTLIILKFDTIPQKKGFMRFIYFYSIQTIKRPVNK